MTIESRIDCLEAKAKIVNDSIIAIAKVLIKIKGELNILFEEEAFGSLLITQVLKEKMKLSKKEIDKLIGKVTSEHKELLGQMKIV